MSLIKEINVNLAQLFRNSLGMIVAFAIVMQSVNEAINFTNFLNIFYVA